MRFAFWVGCGLVDVGRLVSTLLDDRHADVSLSFDEVCNKIGVSAKTARDVYRASRVSEGSGA